MNWKGEQIVPKKWIEEITNMDQQSEDAFDNEYWKNERQTIWTGYKYIWWLKIAKKAANNDSVETKIAFNSIIDLVRTL